MNLMENVAKLLGVKLEQEFMIKKTSGIYKLTDDGLKYKTVGDWYHSSDLEKLITGKYEIKRG